MQTLSSLKVYLPSEATIVHPFTVASTRASQVHPRMCLFLNFGVGWGGGRDHRRNHLLPEEGSPIRNGPRAEMTRTRHLIPTASAFPRSSQPGAPMWAPTSPPANPFCPEPVPDCGPVCPRPQHRLPPEQVLRERPSQTSSQERALAPVLFPTSAQRPLQIFLSACQQPGAPQSRRRTETRPELSLPLRRASRPTRVHLPTSPPRGNSGKRTGLHSWEPVLRSGPFRLLLS